MQARAPASSDTIQLRLLMAEQKEDESEKSASAAAVGSRAPPGRYKRPSYQSAYHNQWGQQQQQQQQQQGAFSGHHRHPRHGFTTTRIDKALAMRTVDLQAGDPIPGKGGYPGRRQSPESRKPKPWEERKRVIMLWVKTVIAYMACLFAILCLHWAASLRSPDSLGGLEVHVVDFDGQRSDVTALVGPTMTNLTREIHAAAASSSSAPSSRSLGYRIVPASEYGDDPLAVRRAVRSSTSSCWAAVVVNPDATALLLDAASTGNASYDPTAAIQYFVHTARQETVAYRYVLPELEALTARFLTRFGPLWTQMLLTDQSFSPAVMARASAAVNPGVFPVTIDLRPSEPAIATTTVTFGLIYLVLISFITFPFFLPLYNKYIQPQDHQSRRSLRAAARRWATTLMVYLCASLAYSLVPLAFGVPFGQAGGAFAAFWMVNFAGMAALGLASESMSMALGGAGRPWTLVWLLFWATTNAAAAMDALELAPTFFAWARAWPLHHVAQASRRILFDLGDSGSGSGSGDSNTGNDIGFHFGVLIAWVLLGTALFPVCFSYMRRRTRYECVPGNRLVEEERYVGSTNVATADAVVDGETEYLKR